MPNSVAHRTGRVEGLKQYAVIRVVNKSVLKYKKWTDY